MRWIQVTTLPILAFLAAAMVYANLDGPPPGFTNAPGEQTCSTAGCHDLPSNRVGRLRLYAAGPVGTDMIGYTIDLADLAAGPPQHDWGFQLTVLDSSNQPFGTLVVVDSLRTKLTMGGNGRAYLSHTAAGVPGLPGYGGFTQWQFRWVRPADATVEDSAYFYMAGLIANGDGLPAGDVTVPVSSIQRSYYCAVAVVGDVNGNQEVSSADVIWLVGYIFKGGQVPLPCTAAGDVNCDMNITAADVITVVNYIFKSGSPPCDVCPLILDGTWEC